MRKIELLSPAKNADIGIEAIRHGADAVYIGATAFGARSAAGNSIEDIQRLCDYAHLFDAKVYVTLNTILYDDELTEAEALIHRLYAVGVDALIIQDLGLLRLDLPPIALHASTQMDITTPGKAEWIEAAGFSQMVLARELSLAEIRAVHQRVKIPLEAFVHGALCVSYSGRCYVSEHCQQRSANRGRCSQFCRLAFDLVDAHDQVLLKDQHLLSLKDLNRSDSIEEMLAAGVSSFKIEGRLKDLSYVKNITAFYRQKIDAILAAHPDTYTRASFGSSTYEFTPQPEKSFNRGFTDYFLHKRAAVASTETPKSKGEYLGKVKQSTREGIVLDTKATLAAGDGLCYINAQGKLEGFRINRLVGTRIQPSESFILPKGTPVYRNFNLLFEKQLAKPTAERKLSATFALQITDKGYRLTLSDESGQQVERDFAAPHESARTPQTENVKRNLSKTGNTPFAIIICKVPEIPYFIPASTLSEWRRLMVEALLEKHKNNYVRPLRETEKGEVKLPETVDYRANIANKMAASYYREHGTKEMSPAYELRPVQRALLMTCKHCILFNSGHCLKRHHPAKAWQLPLHLRLPDGRKFGLQFNCTACEMTVTTYD